MTDLLPFWDTQGNIHHIEDYPDTWYEWKTGNDKPLNSDKAQLVEAIENEFKSKVVSTSPWADDGVVM